MTVECHQVVFTGPGAARVQLRELPSIEPEEIRIRTKVSLISPGTERAFFLGLPNTTQTYPQFTGYNNIGEIIEVGEHVAGLEVGMRVASPAHHASLVQIAGSEAYLIPDGVDDESASFFNLTSIALQGVREARFEIGESVAVLGAGLVGLLAAQLAQINGALPVTVIERDATRMAFARSVGVDAVVGPDEVDAGGILASDMAPTVVIEATGHPDAVNAALTITAPAGRVVLLGSTRGVTPEVNFYRDVHRKGLTVIGAHDIARPHSESHAGYWTQGDDRRVALRLLAAGRLQVRPLITHRLHWQDAESGYETLKSWDANALGIVLNWRDQN